MFMTSWRGVNLTLLSNNNTSDNRIMLCYKFCIQKPLDLYQVKVKKKLNRHNPGNTGQYVVFICGRCRNMKAWLIILSSRKHLLQVMIPQFNQIHNNKVVVVVCRNTGMTSINRMDDVSDWSLVSHSPTHCMWRVSYK